MAFANKVQSCGTKQCSNHSLDMLDLLSPSHLQHRGRSEVQNLDGRRHSGAGSISVQARREFNVINSPHKCPSLAVFTILLLVKHHNWLSLDVSSCQILEIRGNLRACLVSSSTRAGCPARADPWKSRSFLEDLWLVSLIFQPCQDWVYSLEGVQDSQALEETHSVVLPTKPQPAQNFSARIPTQPLQEPQPYVSRNTTVATTFENIGARTPDRGHVNGSVQRATVGLQVFDALCVRCCCSRWCPCLEGVRFRAV